MMLERKKNGNFKKHTQKERCVMLLDRRNSKELMDMLGIEES